VLPLCRPSHATQERKPTRRRPGAGTNISTEVAAKASSDGYSLLMFGTSNAVNPSLYDKLNFDVIRDFAPVGGVIRAPFVLDVNLAMPVKTVPEFIAYAKANPGRINMASAGNGAASHMTGELFKMMAGVNMQHVPYRGGGPALLDLIAGQVQVYFAGMPETIEYIRAGTVRPLAVTSATRAEALPDLPTVAEFVPGYESNVWFGVAAPRNTPASPTPSSKRDLPTSARRCFRARPPTSASSSPRKPRSGPRWSSSRVSSRTDPVSLDRIFHISRPTNPACRRNAVPNGEASVETAVQRVV